MVSKAPDNESGVGVVESVESTIPFPTDERQSKNIFQRLWLASNMIGQIEKEKSAAKGLPYKFVSHDNVTARAKEAFAKVGIYHFASILEMTQEANRTVAKVELSFVNVDVPSEVVKTVSHGYGVDNQDKGPGKAYSYAVKYGLMKALMLNTNEDIESDNTDYSGGHDAKVAEANESAREAIQAWASTFKAAIENAPDLEALTKLEKENKTRLTSSALPDVTRTFFIELIQKRKGDLS